MMLELLIHFLLTIKTSFNDFAVVKFSISGQ